jgi:hypothetical protein
MSTTESARTQEREKASPIVRHLERLGEEGGPAGIPEARLRKAAEALHRQGIFTVTHMAERAMRGVALGRECELLGLTADETKAVLQHAVDSLPARDRDAIARLAALPRPTGGLNPSDPDYAERLKKLQAIPAMTDRDLKALGDQRLNPFQPLGPTRAVDHRVCFGPVRTQDGPTCAAFGATAVAEALESLRDRRTAPMDLSEELCWWHAKGGQTVSGANGDAFTMLNTFVTQGGCEEWMHPFKTPHILANWAHVPVPDEAIDRARLFKQLEAMRVADGDVNGMKAVLISGRCAVVDVNQWGFDAIHGMIAYPNADSQAHDCRTGHIVAIVGYCERPDLDPAWGGGCFIVRNSWGAWLQNGASLNYLGPEFAGHLIMPYEWFRRYSGTCFALGDLGAGNGLPMTSWAAEYYPNTSLVGTPLYTGEEDWYLSHAWNGASPAAGVAGQNFSARFTQLRRFRPGWYEFKLSGDDGVRLWVDDKLVVNGWTVQAPTTYAREHFVSGGDHVLRVEYYQVSGGATVKLDVNPVNFRYDLFDNGDLAGSPFASFQDTSTEQEWRHVAPVGASGVFSARVTGRKTFAPGTYRFHSRHTGSCVIRVNGIAVLDDPDGLHPDGSPVTLAGGTVELTVEFKHKVAYPALWSGAYYRALLGFDWSEDFWQYDLHRDPGHEQVESQKYPHGPYEGFHTLALSGAPIATAQLKASHSVQGEYSARDGVPMHLAFADSSQFAVGLPPGLPMPAKFWSAHLQRRFWIPNDGRYLLSLAASDGYRVVVDGKELIRDRGGFGSNDERAPCDLKAGVHDIAIELTAGVWGMNLDLGLKLPSWRVQYFAYGDLKTPVAERTSPLQEVIANVPQQLKAAGHTIRVTPCCDDCEVWAPVGRYRLSVLAHGDVEVQLAGATVARAAQAQSAAWTNVVAEHTGGVIPLALVYAYRPASTWDEPAALDLQLHPAGCFGEYYGGTSLEKGAGGAVTPPRSYRFDPAVFMNWGDSPPMPRFDASNWSARWYGQIELPVGRYKVNLTGDDGVRLWLDGRPVFDRWQVQAPTNLARTVDLTGRAHVVRVEYFQASGGARAQLSFDRLPGPPFVPIN